MTDNEIIKALENEIRSAEYVDSEYCDGVDLTLIKSAIDLINRQQEKIEKLNKEMEGWRDTAYHEASIRDTAEINAIREFAKRLNEEAQMADCFDSYNMVVGTHFIDNLLKEIIDE